MSVESQPIDVEAVVPPELSVPSNPSAGKAILNDRWAEIPPESQETFTYASNDTITFRIGSTQELLNFAMSYIRFDFENTTPNLAGVQIIPSLDVGGLHALFREIVISTVNGNVELERRRRYNKDFVRRSYTNDSREKVLNEGWKYWDDVHESVVMDHGASIPPDTVLVFDNPGAADNALSAAATGVISEIAPGDTLVDAAGDPFPITQVRTERAGALDARTRVFTHNNFTNLQTDYRLIKGGVRTSRRQLANDLKQGQTDVIRTKRACFMPDLELWQRMFPLMMIHGGLRLTLILEHPDRVFHSSDVAAALGANDYNYSISNVRFVGRYVTIHRNIRNVMRRQFDTDQGIDMRIRGTRVRVVNRPGDTPSDTIQVHPGLRSVRGVQIVFMDQSISDGTGNDTRSNASLSSMMSTHITEMFLTIGALRIPDTPIDIDWEGHEMLKHLMYYGKRWNLQSTPFRFSREDWEPGHRYQMTAAGAAQDSRSRIYSFDFARSDEPYGFLTGLDTTNSTLICNLRREGRFPSHTTQAGFAASINVYFWFDYDLIITLGRSGVTTSL